MVALSVHRMAKGLCMKYGEKWSRAHQCAATVQLNALHEVWDVLEQNVSEVNPTSRTSSEPEQLFMALSETVASRMDGPRTLKIRGHIQSMEILILIDSGSTHSFLSE